jgi:hypothetical protein
LQDGEIPKLGGAVPFTVEQAAPSSLKFWEIKPSGATPKPASTLLGTFTFGTNGVLTFSVIGTVEAPTIQISRFGGTNIISFPTTSGGTYSLRWTNVLGSAVTNWAAISGSVTGNGAVQTLSHAPAGAAAFYSVERNP